MGWFTKKNYGWEIKRMAWPIIALVTFLPLPIHMFPFAFIAQGSSAKVRSWITTGIVFLIAEVAVLLLFFLKFRQADLETLSASLITIISFLALYLIGNAMLLRNVKPYMERMELNEVMELEWISSIRTIKVWKPDTINSPQSFVAQLLADRNEIDNYSIKRNIDQIINYFKTIIDTDCKKAEILAVRHQTILSLLEQYKNLQKSNINNSLTTSSKNEIEKVLNQAVVAVENEITNQYETKLLGVSAEGDAYLQQLKSRNLIK